MTDGIGLDRDRRPPARLGPAARGLLTTAVVVYALYALYMVVEVLDFLALLHADGGEERATYSMVEVAFLMVEQGVCTAFALIFLLVRLHARQGEGAVAAAAVLTLIRACLAFYLYLWTNDDTHTVPFIYKEANPFSDLLRLTFVSAQLLVGMACIWACRRQRAVTASEIAEPGPGV